MKKLVMFLLVIIMVTGCLYSQFAVNKTASIDSTLMNAIRSDFSGGDGFAAKNWYWFINSPAHQDESDSLSLDDSSRYVEPFQSDTYLKDAIWGAIGLDIPLGFSSSGFLNDAKDYLINPEYPNYLNLDAVWDSLHVEIDVSHPWFHLLLNNVCIMTDMLWYYVSAQDRIDICTKLDSLVDTLYVNLERTKSTWGLGDDPNFIGVSPYAATIGYAGCLMNNTDYIDYAIDLIFEYDIPHLTDSQEGYLDFFITNAYYYGEGPLYIGCNIISQIMPFFTAYLRMYNVNLYNHPLLTNLYVNLQNLITPPMKGLPTDDSFWSIAQYYHLDSVYEYYYNNTNTSSDNWIRWYFNEFDAIYYPSVNQYPIMPVWWRYFYPVISYNPYKSIHIMDNYTLPYRLQEGSYSDAELAVFRKNCISQSDFVNSTSVYVNYDNALDISGHEHCDQTSFQMFSDSLYILIDPCYRAGSYSHNWENAMEWLHSPYAHNLIIVNPDSTVEYNHILDHYLGNENSPTTHLINSDTGKYWEPHYRNMINLNANPIPDVSVPNPAFKEYFINGINIDNLKIYMDYIEDPLGSDKITVYRNFYYIDDTYTIIYDQIDNDNETNNNPYWNQLHYAAYSGETSNTNISENLVTTNLNNELYLYSTIGANSSYYLVLEHGLPYGNCSHTYKHSRLKAVTEAKDTEFLTLLITSESSTNPIDPDYVESGTGYYGAKIDIDTTDDYASYVGIKNETQGSFSFTESPQVYIETDAEFFLVEANSDFDDYKKIILNGGNELELQTNILVFDSNHNFEEMLASYDNDELHITFKTEQNDYPKYKILRCGIEPEDLYSKTEFGTYHQGTTPNNRGTIEDNILSLAYDENYFYVNYSYAELISEGFISDNLILFTGSYPYTVFVTNGYPDKLRFDGEVSLSGIYTIADTIELVFEAGANPNLSSTAKFDVYGSVSAVGASNEKIYFNTDSDWDGFYIRDGGEAEFEYCEFENSKYPIRCLGAISIKNCEVSNCTNGLYLQACDGYTIQNNEFDNCYNVGLLVSNMNPFFHVSHAIWNNEIHHNQYGIYLFNTNVEIDSNYVHNNSNYGILAASGTSSIIKNSCIQYSDNPEIYLVDESYPIIDYMDNDIIFEEGYSIYNADKAPISYYCRDNYWGTNNQNEIGNSFYPTTWNVYYDPWLTSNATGFSRGRETSLFEMGLAAEEAGSIDLARNYYLQCIDEGNEELEKVWSASRLMDCIDENNGFSYDDLQILYDTISNDTINFVLSELAKKLSINCDRKNANYQQAITKYENILNDSISYIDSLLVQLNIVHTYLEAESSSGRALLSFQNSNNSIKNHKQAIEKETELMNMLFMETNLSDNTPIIDHIVLYPNFPNPFNPSTTISFSVPEESNVELSIYNIKGQKIKTLINDEFPKGTHSLIWNGDDDYKKKVASGVYFYKLKVNGKNSSIKKCLLLK